MLPSGIVSGARIKYDQDNVVASYMWSHYADMAGDDEANTAYLEWARLIDIKPGFALDTGCSVGRFTFELGRNTDFAIGIDYSYESIKMARSIMLAKRGNFSLPEEGKIFQEYGFTLSDKYTKENVEFVVGDAQRLPFASHIFSTCSSLNLIDKVPYPINHLREIDRVAKIQDAQILISDPFSWSEEIAEEEDWLGGKETGLWSGSGIENIITIFSDKEDIISPLWQLNAKGDLWWKIKNHRNHFEMIRSPYIKIIRIKKASSLL